jgi:hypothetical protein
MKTAMAHCLRTCDRHYEADAIMVDGIGQQDIAEFIAQFTRSNTFRRE